MIMMEHLGTALVKINNLLICSIVLIRLVLHLKKTIIKCLYFIVLFY